jgi:gamma-glutamylcysteine synthetase
MIKVIYNFSSKYNHVRSCYKELIVTNTTVQSDRISDEYFKRKLHLKYKWIVSLLDGVVPLAV